MKNDFLITGNSKLQLGKSLNCKSNNSTRFNLVYNFAFVTRYRRKIFGDEIIKNRANIIIKEKCEELNLELLQIEVFDDYIILVIKSIPSYSPRYIIQSIKRSCSSILISEFNELQSIPNLFIKPFIVSTEKLNQEVIENFVNEQKTRS